MKGLDDLKYSSSLLRIRSVLAFSCEKIYDGIQYVFNLNGCYIQSINSFLEGN